MAIGAEDYLDQLLVQKYATEQVDNHDNTESAVSPEQMMNTMNNYSTAGRNMFLLNQKLTAACSAVNAVNAQYRRSQVIAA